MSQNLKGQMKPRFDRESFSILPFCFYFNRSVGGGDAAAAAMCVRTVIVFRRNVVLSSPLLSSPADRDFRGYNNGRTSNVECGGRWWTDCRTGRHDGRSINDHPYLLGLSYIIVLHFVPYTRTSYGLLLTRGDIPNLERSSYHPICVR